MHVELNSRSARSAVTKTNPLTHYSFFSLFFKESIRIYFFHNKRCEMVSNAHLNFKSTGLYLITIYCWYNNLNYLTNFWKGPLFFFYMMYKIHFEIMKFYWESEIVRFTAFFCDSPHEWIYHFIMLEHLSYNLNN